MNDGTHAATNNFFNTIATSLTSIHSATATGSLTGGGSDLSLLPDMNNDTLSFIINNVYNKEIQNFPQEILKLYALDLASNQPKNFSIKSTEYFLLTLNQISEILVASTQGVKDAMTGGAVFYNYSKKDTQNIVATDAIFSIILNYDICFDNIQNCKKLVSTSSPPSSPTSSRSSTMSSLTSTSTMPPLSKIIIASIWNLYDSLKDLKKTITTVQSNNIKNNSTVLDEAKIQSYDDIVSNLLATVKTMLENGFS